MLRATALMFTLVMGLVLPPVSMAAESGTKDEAVAMVKRVQEKFKKQNYNIVPSKSVADAQNWLAGEIKHWETVTNTVMIDVGQ